MYLSVKKKFILSTTIIAAWVIFSIWLDVYWFISLRQDLPALLSLFIIFVLSICPGIMMSLMLCGVIFDKQRPHVLLSSLDDITIIIACYNEESSIYETIECISKQAFPANIIINCVDNNSSDRTKEEIMRAKVNFPNLQINYIFERRQGKFYASNTGLSLTSTKYVISLDADTFLYRDSLLTLVSTMSTQSANKPVGAIAGAIFVRNSRDNLLTKLQEWDYFMSIAAIKRAQGLFQSTLVAQGAYSIYQTSVLKDIGGWSDSIGEDIVVSWTLLEQGYKIYYEPLAIAFTNVPKKFKIFARQRARWARGMIEGFRHVKFYRCRNPYSRLLIAFDYLLILIDFGMTFVWIPGLIACGLGWSKVVGPLTLILLPITIIVFTFLIITERNRVFKYYNLKIRKHYGSLIVFLLTYSMIMSPISLYGYFQEIFRLKRVWK